MQKDEILTVCVVNLIVAFFFKWPSCGSDNAGQRFIGNNWTLESVESLAATYQVSHKNVLLLWVFLIRCT